MSYKPVNSLLWIDIAVLNLDRAIAFYQSVLNTVAFDARPSLNSATLKLSQHGSGITLILAEKVITGTITPYLNCQGRLDQAISQARLNGGTIIQDKHSMEPFGQRAVILDTEGNRLALHSA